VVACPRQFEPAEQVALAFVECGCLGEYVTGFVWKGDLRSIDAIEGLVGPRGSAALRRRSLPLLPPEVVRSFRTIDVARTAASALGLRGVEDRIWERDDHRFAARACSALDACDTVHGYEHASLELFREAKARGKNTVLHVASIHPVAHDAIFDREYERYPEFKNSTSWRLRERRHRRDARRIQEYALADVLVSWSSFSTRSLVEHGVPAARIEQVPMGARPAEAAAESAVERSGPLRVLFAGKVGFHKGCHLLLEAWRSGPSTDAVLLMAGQNELPEAVQMPQGVRLTGSVSQAALFRLMEECDLLVLPTLCDTFGMVIGEAFMHGLPVLTTANAGAADLVVENVSGWVVPAGEVRPLAERLAWCDSHLDVLRSMRAATRRSAKVRSWADFRADLRSALARRGLL
jgi:glycosyltransferase involved in cell wall biosynthesis